MSGNSLQGVRGLMNLSQEKREDGLSTPTHAASNGKADRSSAPHAFDSDDDNDNRNDGGVEDAATPGAVATTAATATTASSSTELVNPNKHLRVSDLLQGGPAFAFEFADPVALDADGHPQLPAAVRGTEATPESGAAGADTHAGPSTDGFSAELDDAIASTQRWREEQAAKLQQQLRDMKRAHRRELQKQQRAAVESDLARFSATASSSDSAGSPQSGQDGGPATDPAPDADADANHDASGPAVPESSEVDNDVGDLAHELQRLRLKAQHLRDDNARVSGAVSTASHNPALLERLRAETTGSLLANDSLVSRSGQVYSTSVENRMEQLDMTARLADLQMSAVGDEQVQQRQDAALEDAIQFAGTNSVGATDLEDKLGSYGDALADILAKLDSLGDSGNGGSKNDDRGAAATNTQSAGVPSGGVAQ